jgi:hypothetical protein
MIVDYYLAMNRITPAIKIVYETEQLFSSIL